MDVVPISKTNVGVEEGECWWTEQDLTLIIPQERERAMEAAEMEETIQVMTLDFRELFC